MKGGNTMLFRMSRISRRRLKTVALIVTVAAFLTGGILFFIEIRQGICDMYETRIGELERQLADYEGLMTVAQEYGDDRRLVEYESVLISSGVMQGDYVDIRILYPDGRDYVVLSKKQIMDINPAVGRISLCVGDDEIHRMDRALVVCEEDPHRGLYMTKYIEPAFQEASQVDF